VKFFVEVKLLLLFLSVLADPLGRQGIVLSPAFQASGRVDNDTLQSLVRSEVSFW
jgi:hypothetical protein